MADLLTTGNITFTLGILAILFSLWGKIKDPQAVSDKRDALLAQQMKWMADGTERRFKDMQDSFNALLLQSNNHIHTVDTKVETLTMTVGTMSNEITKLATVIDERIPKKGV